MKKINKLLFIFFIIFVNIKLVNAFTSDSCMNGYTLVGDYTCFKSIPAQNYYGKYACTNDMGELQGKECISYYNLEQPSNENNNCDSGYTAIGGYCYKYIGSARNYYGVYSCVYGTNIGVSCYDIKNTNNNNEILNNENVNNDNKVEYEVIDYRKVCTSDEGVRKVVKFTGTIILICRFIAPLLIIVLGMIDFGKSVMSNDDKAISKSSQALIRRFIAGVAIFFIPLLLSYGINFVSKVLNNGKEDTNSLKDCTICVLNVNKCK